MRSGSAAIDIHAPPEVVFDLLHDYSRRLDWDPFLREARLLNEAMVAEMTACGGLIILGIGFILLDVAKPRVANFLPSLVIAPFIVRVVSS